MDDAKVWFFWFFVGVFVALVLVSNDDKIAFVKQNDSYKFISYDNKVYKLEEIK